MKTVHLIVTGKVQGVFYRASAKTVALALRLNGWVRNCADGTVEILVSGTDENVQEFIHWSKQGPAGAAVSGVAIREVAPVQLSKFEIRT
jgi:acylphosphatase